MSGDHGALESDDLPVPDAALLQRVARSADRHALEHLKRRYETTLHAVAFGMLFDSQQARRAVARAWLEVRRSAVAFDARCGSVATLLVNVTRRCARALITTPSVPPGATDEASP